MTALSRYPVVYASLVAPAGRRRRWAILTGACDLCDGGRHIHFVHRPVDAAGARRAGCGNGTYWLVVNRRYARKAVRRVA